MLKRGLLEEYVNSFENNGKHILEEFNDSLVYASENTKKAYNTDVWMFLRDKFFCFWDFDIKYNRVAQNLALVHALDLAEQNNERERKRLLREAVFRSKALLSDNKDRALVSKRKISYEILGRDFDYSYSEDGNRFRMQLRAADTKGIEVKIREEDKLMLNFIMKSYEKSMDSDFWDDIFREDKIGEVLMYQENKGVSKNTLARRMIALKKFEKFLYKRKLVSERVMIDMQVPYVEPKIQIQLDKKELMDLLKYADKKYQASSGKEKRIAGRNRAMIGILAGTLIRGSALCNSRIKDLNPEKGELFVSEKGRKEKIVIIPKKALAYAKDFLNYDRDNFISYFNVQKQYFDYTFHTTRGLPMNRRSLSRIINEYAIASGIRKNIGGKTCVGSHAMRRSIADLMSIKGARIEDMKEILGHKHIATTERYLASLRNARPSTKKTLEKYHPMEK